MNRRSLFLLAAVTSALALGYGAGFASGSDVLCREEAEVCTEDLETGAAINASLSSFAILLTTEYEAEPIACFSSSLGTSITATGAPTEIAKASVESLGFASCFTEFGLCEFKVLKPGTMEFQPIEKSTNGTVKSSGMELTTNCEVEAGTVHCIYKTENTDFGLLKAGATPVIEVAAQLSHVSTNPACEGKAELSGAYKVTSPKPLYVEPSAATPKAPTAVLCTEAATPCGKDEPVNTEIEANLVAGAKAVLATPYKKIECSKVPVSGITTTTGGSEEAVTGNVVVLFPQECNCKPIVILKGQFITQNIEGTANGTLESTEAELTTNCSTVFGTIHCIYVTLGTDLGTIVGGNPATVEIGADIPRLSTNAMCAEEAALSGKFEITSPKPLYVEPG